MSAALALAALSASPAASALPEDPGTLTFQKQTENATLAGQSVAFDLYVPDVSAPAPIVVVGHGFQRARANVAEWGEALAKRGYVAAAPDFPGGLSPDHALNGKIVSALLQWMVTSAGQAGSPLAGRVDPGRRAAIGHSAGGLAALLATAQDSTIDLVIGLDPVDTDNRGLTAAPSITVPAVFIRAEPASCNANGNAAAIFAALGGPKLTLSVKGSTHCDAESPSDFFCGLFCGGARDDTRHQSYRRYAFAALDQRLLCDAAMAPWLGGAQASADGAIDSVSASGFPPAQLGCAAASDGGGVDPDGGTASDDGGPADAGTQADLTPDAGPASSGDGGGSSDGATPPIPTSDGGCSCRFGGSPAGWPWLSLIGLLALVRVTIRNSPCASQPSHSSTNRRHP